jgi:AAA+ ATPase superfamily predicted ATPase
LRVSKEKGINFTNAEKVYRELGGNPGWLTYYGYVYLREGEENALIRVKHYAKRLLAKELCNFIMEGNRSLKRYLKIIETCKDGCSWKEIRNGLEALEGRAINDKIVKTIIENLIDYSLLIKEEKYQLADPLLADIRVSQCS